MAELLQFLQTSVGSMQIGAFVDHWRDIVLTDAVAWLLIVGFIRFDVPAFAFWVAKLVHPRAFGPMQGRGAYLPSVSVIIAGRNPGKEIRRTIRSLLDSGYPKLEIVYVDDFSTDDSVVHAREFERTGRVRVFAAAQHNGKPSNLNVALAAARGELAFVLDADTEVEHGTIARLVAYFRDPEVGAVSADIHVRNASANLLTRIQEIEYALNGSIARSWHAQIGLLPILPGAASMFRMSALRELGGYDTGLGDDTDMTLRMRKRRQWRLKYALEARIWTDQPENLRSLLRQRMRWTRNMVKVRLHKHRDLFTPRYGWQNLVLAIDIALFRVCLPLFSSWAIAWGLLTNFGERAVVFTSLYVFALFFVFCKVLIANDVAGTPPFFDFFLIPLYLPYRLILRTGDAIAIVRETLRIRLYHPYVPKRIWDEIPHW
jgi:cellulose synthase/poly-beta-1,6-N-acetylglucosamine synthase-like glycosyltransferase